MHFILCTKTFLQTLREISSSDVLLFIHAHVKNLKKETFPPSDLECEAAQYNILWIVYFFSWSVG